MLRWIVVLGLALAGCDSTPCEDATLLTACPECGPGEVRAGITTTSLGRAIARPGGGIARIGCDTHLVRHDSAFAVADDVGLYAEGTPALWSVAIDDLVLVVDRPRDGLDQADLVAVVASGTEVWRIPTGADRVALTLAGGYAIAYGWTEEAVSFGEFTVQGLFAVGLGALDGQPVWAWSWSQGFEAEMVAIGAADGSVVLAGTFAGGLDLGGTSAPLNAGATAGFVGVLDPSGAGVWARQLIGPAASDVAAVTRAPDGSIVIAGGFSGGTLDLDTVVLRPAAATADQFVAVLEPDGTPRWGMLLGDSTAEPIQAITASETGVVVGGWHIDGPLSFGSDTVPQEWDAYLASLADGAVSWLVQVGGAGNQAIASLGWNGALHASIVQYAAEGEPPASLDFRDLALEGDGTLHLELAP